MQCKENIIGKDSPSPPAAPDYAGAAQAQGVANAEAARLSGRMANPNVYGPYGSQTVTYGADTPQFNQGAFDNANQAYNQQLQQYNATGGRGGIIGYGGEGGDTPIYGQGGGVAPIAPNREQYTTMTPNDQPTVTQTLNPQAQQTLEAQQRVQTGLANLGEQGIGTAQRIMGKPFSFGGPAIQTSLGPAGPIQTGVNPAGYEAQRLDTSGIAAMPVNAGTTAQQAIMSRLDPSIARNRVSTETQLINQGLRPGGEAYNNAINLLGQQENDARTQAALQGINLDFAANQQGFGQATAQNAIANQAAAQNLQNLQNYQAQQNAAQGTQFNQGLQGAQFANTAQQNALAQALQQRQMPLNEITALMSGSQIQNPTFQQYQGQSVAPAQVAQAAAQQAQYGQNIYNQQMGQQNVNTAGLFSLGGALIGGPAGAKAGSFLGNLMG